MYTAKFETFFNPRVKGVFESSVFINNQNFFISQKWWRGSNETKLTLET